MNNRNSEIIMLYNPRSAFPLVDDKIITKQLATRHDIPTPALYGVIRKHNEIRHFHNIIQEKTSFVVKPSRGSGGSGIILIKEIAGDTLVTASGRSLQITDLTYHIADILSGIFSLESLEDSALIEALIEPDDIFKPVTFKGIPDIRVVVYRGVPVMAMVRLPTIASDGKANLHGGAIGAGIDIKHGVTSTAVCKSSIVTHHPDTGISVSNIEVPHWEKILIVAARSWDMTGLGYIGVDLVIDRSAGPLLLELNARPGLAIQMANRTGLLKRIETVDRAPEEIFGTPETRVQWARQNF